MTPADDFKSVSRQWIHSKSSFPAEPHCGEMLGQKEADRIPTTWPEMGFLYFLFHGDLRLWSFITIGSYLVLCKSPHLHLMRDAC